jgi:hypothetical protein
VNTKQLQHYIRQKRCLFPVTIVIKVINNNNAYVCETWTPPLKPVTVFERIQDSGGDRIVIQYNSVDKELVQ